MSGIARLKLPTAKGTGILDRFTILLDLVELHGGQYEGKTQ